MNIPHEVHNKIRKDAINKFLESVEIAYYSNEVSTDYLVSDLHSIRELVFQKMDKRLEKNTRRKTPMIDLDTL